MSETGETEERAEETRPLLRVVRGNPSPEEVAALVAVVSALDLATGAVSGVAADVRNVIRQAGGNPDDPASAAEALSADLFGKGLSRATREAAARVSRSGPVPVAARVTGLVLAGPEMQAR